MSAPVLFDRGGQQLRVVVDDQGEPLFVAADVAAMLGYRIAPDMVRSLDDDERGTHAVRTPGGEQMMTVLTEPGLYRAIMNRRAGAVTSDRARGQVKAFQRWVTHEVLPSIRRTGGYDVPAPAPEPAYRLPATFAEALRELAATVEERDAAQERVQVLEPAAEAWETVTTASGADYSVADAAQVLTNSGWPVGQKRLFDELSVLQWICRTDGHWRPYQRVIEQGLLVSRLRPPFMNRATGELQATAPQVRVTAKGIEKLLAHYQQRAGQLALAPRPTTPTTRSGP